jgi:hypothetical protein
MHKQIANLLTKPLGRIHFDLKKKVASVIKGD